MHGAARNRRFRRFRVVRGYGLDPLAFFLPFLDASQHHLIIMESLGGNSNIIDRVLAQSMAFGYYWYVIVVYFLSESAAYHLSELIEDHAFNTYNKDVNSRPTSGLMYPRVRTRRRG